CVPVRNHGRTPRFFYAMASFLTTRSFARSAATQTRRKKLRGTMSALSAASNNRSTSKVACDYGCKNLVYRTNPATGTLHLQGGRIVREQDFADVAEQDAGCRHVIR